MVAGKKKIDALNLDYLQHEQVCKRQAYHFTEIEGEEAFDEDFRIKTCDLRLWASARGRTRFIDELGSALQEIGFAIIEGHGIPLEVYRRTGEQVGHLFERTTRAQRMAYRACRHGSVNQGYFPLEETSDIHPDQVEGWVFCRRAFNMRQDPDFDAAAFWPLPELEPVFREYVRLHEPLILPIMQSMLSWLGADPHLYDERLTGTNFGLRLNYYPPMDDAAARSGAARLLGHEDVDMFTLLAAPRVEGLQVLNRRNMKWIRLQAPPGSLILNTGDYMQRISNDILPSTTHRVCKPRDPALHAGTRISHPLNVYLWEDEMLEVLPGLVNPKYDPIRAIQFHTHITGKYYGPNYKVT